MSYIIIDGYNLIRSSPTLSTLDAINIEKGRLKLLQKLSLYREMSGHQVVVVFDANKTTNLSIEEEKIGGIQVFFTKGGQTADEIIIQLARRYKGQVIVVSSDNEIIHAAHAAGCGVLKSEEFEKIINKASIYDGNFDVTDRNKPSPKPVHKRWLTKKRGNPKKLPKAKRKALARLG